MSTAPFDEWKAKVSRRMYQLCGMGPDDLPDFEYWMAWNSGESVEQTARDAIASAREDY